MKVGCHTAKVSAALFKTNRITVLKTGLNHNNTHFHPIPIFIYDLVISASGAASGLLHT